MRDASKTSSVAMPRRQPTRVLWRDRETQQIAQHRGRRSRRKRRHADATAVSALRRVFPGDDVVRAYLAEFARANRALGIGLLSAKLLDSRRPPRDLVAKVRESFPQVQASEVDLRAAASEARMAVQEALRRRFESSPAWHLRWLPEIGDHETTLAPPAR